MNNKSCPISLISVDSNVARINAFFTGMLVITYFLTLQTPILYFLVLDFSTKLFLKKEYSFLFILSSATKDILKFPSVKVDAAPKRLANYFGLLFAILITIATLLEFSTFMYALLIILFLCIFLEVVFNYCLGCEVYHLYKRFLS
ncbi:DUF4395 domain-containing protein [Sulfurimonas sp. SAG-AH-194-C21]|nr:DUF4395 domain-containing protein [Sulfurimonas sp. SAG-AH-194-C21]MDF1882886.1 DUF4395 domain-containing protein [Sulfurimonas sp. SAG-AH-194-C21]